MHRKTKSTATAFAISAAALYAVNIPLSKLLLTKVQPAMMAVFLYLGAGFGLLLCSTPMMRSLATTMSIRK